MNNPYFLTRQTANLMEDFDREIRRGSAMYLVHGESGVGKSRLLRELETSRMADLPLHRIDLGQADEDGEDAAAGTRAALAGRIEELFATAAPGDLVIADHFERASRKCRHQLLQSWSTDGIDKKMNLIVAVDSEGLDELRQLAQQFQAHVGSFRLEPLNRAETEAYAAFYLFPERPIGRLRIPGPVRRRLRHSRGVIGAVRAILDRDGAAIESAPAADDSRAAGLRLVGVLLILVLVAALAWFSLGLGEAVAGPPAPDGGQL